MRLRERVLELEDLRSDSSSSRVTLSKALDLSEPLFPLLQNGNNKSRSPAVDGNI